MTQEQIQALPNNKLMAIVASTSSTGSLWRQKVWAQDELARRARALRKGAA